MKIFHSADWHVGTFHGPEQNGLNLRSEDTYSCIEELVDEVENERPDYVLVPGDIFHQAAIGQARSHTEVLRVRDIISRLSDNAGQVVIMRGTPNHDSAEAFEELKAHFSDKPNVHIVTEAKVLEFSDLCIALVPGFDRGIYRAAHPGLSAEEENTVFTEEIRNIVLGLRAQCTVGKPSVLMAHITVPGCNMEAGQNTFLQNFEPVLSTDTINAADFDLVCLGHIHRPQQLTNVHNTFYSGAINAMNFNDEGQDRGFYVHNVKATGLIDSEFRKTHYRHFKTLHLDDDDIANIISGDYEAVSQGWDDISGCITRILYTCTEDHHKALNNAELEKYLYNLGAFYVWEISPESISQSISRTDMGNTDPEENLRRWLKDRGHEDEGIERIVLLARPVIDKALANNKAKAYTGAFIPKRIKVKNYRNYEEEDFDFSGVKFATINGENGTGKSSLFMDAIIDCLWEQPREHTNTGWIRNDPEAHSGAIEFTFGIGDKTFRVTRTRAKSGKTTLNIAELMDSEWVNMSEEKKDDTQKAIDRVIGMDAQTFKSVALIMQDQYGLFLEAKPDQRMEILSKILGLDIYTPMYNEAYELARIHGRKKDDAKKEIELEESEIAGYGNPESEMVPLKARINELQNEVSEKTKERDEKNALLKSLDMVKQQADESILTINTLEAKKNGYLAERDHQVEVSKTYLGMLENEELIKDKANKAREAEQDYYKAQKEAAVYAQIKDKVAKATASESNDELLVRNKKFILESDNMQLESLSRNTNAEEIKAKDEEYKACLEKLTELQVKRENWITAKAELQKAQVDRDMQFTKLKSEEKTLLHQAEVLEKKTELLKESGCIDIENADCKFLQDAKQAQKELASLRPVIASHEAKMTETLNPLNEKIKAAETALCATEDVSAEYDELTLKKATLAPYHNKAQKLEATNKKIIELKAQIEADKSALSEAETRLSESKKALDSAKKEAEQYGDADAAMAEAKKQYEDLKHWIDSENSLPLYREKLSNANEKVEELTQRISEATTQINDTKEKWLELSSKTAQIDSIRVSVEGMNADIEMLNGQLAEKQKMLGTLEQKAEQIKKLEDQIKDVRKTVDEESKTTADYDELKAAFHVRGIPHQIIQSIIPKLAGTANTILGEMTGGRMGVSFELTTVNSNKVEKVSLEVLIRESGRSELPYLSKSGGEKVKASLSVILALAEVKSGTAGMQLGMLFIDEPPFLDADGVQAYCDALQTIQKRYPNLKVMAITHDPSMKARFPQTVTVTKDEHGSHAELS